MSYTYEKALFGAGCFWGVQEKFDALHGVVQTTVGYSGGHTTSPTYEQVCQGDTGHVEVVLVEFDPREVSYSELVAFFLSLGGAHKEQLKGSQYRAVIAYFTSQQRDEAQAEIQAFSERTGMKVPVEIFQAMPFTPAEEYHQKYVQKNRP